MQPGSVISLYCVFKPEYLLVLFLVFGTMFSFRQLIEQPHDGRNRRLLAGTGHGSGIGLTLRIQGPDGINQLFIQDTILLALDKDLGKALGLEGSGVEDLVAPGPDGERDQEVGLLQGQDLEDGICAGAGDDDVRSGKQMLEVLLDIFKLLIALDAVSGGIVFAGAAQVHDAEILQELVQVPPDSFIDGLGALAPAHDHEDGLL